ncbi:hypothetical protein IW261DRAFT_1573909 [Armillaria novae-zelandiae]|uniref:Uncharacterized protein n=1 Tax=Armillaria novae-zelandiae TaxID=153914 RepID=A0AA39NL71_9AGAR|nr:hypothetical protein IW261DRAFT_1573909 [Armillaria novae-zelandiae]
MDLALEQSYSTLTNVRCLTVKEWPKMDDLLGTLCIRPGRNVIFPKMSELELIESRRDQGALREFNITWQWGVINYDADTRSRMATTFVRQGEEYKSQHPSKVA